MDNSLATSSNGSNLQSSSLSLVQV